MGAWMSSGRFRSSPEARAKVSNVGAGLHAHRQRELVEVCAGQAVHSNPQGGGDVKAGKPIQLGSRKPGEHAGVPSTSSPAPSGRRRQSRLGGRLALLGRQSRQVARRCGHRAVNTSAAMRPIKVCWPLGEVGNWLAPWLAPGWYPGPHPGRIQTPAEV